MRRSGFVRALCRAALLGVLPLLLAPRAALAHGDEMGEPAAETGPVTPGPDATPVTIEIEVPASAELGDTVTASATLTDADGMSIVGATVIFETDAAWGELAGHMEIGRAQTDEAGVASISYEVRASGEIEVAAEFEGDLDHLPAVEETTFDVSGDAQLYEPSVGLRIPWLNLWVLASVIMLVWGVYLAVGMRVLRIVRLGRLGVPVSVAGQEAAVAGIGPSSTRRQFLQGLLPVGIQMSIAAFGAGLVALVVRSPHTHGNLLAPPSTAAYQRSPVARVGQMTEMREMPMPLERDVSFSKEILPIFLANGGPHVVMPEHSPPPGGLLLDSYEHLMEKEGVIVPGDPEESEMIEHLLSVGMQMPPSISPLPDAQIQLIVTWIAQGARNN